MELKQNLISSLKLVAYYICVNVAFSLLLATFYMIYTLCLNLVAGQQLHFDVTVFVNGFLFFEPFVMVFSGALLAFFMIRHPEDNVIALVIAVVIYVLLWLALIPGTVRLAKDIATPAAGDSTPVTSSGYFRKTDENIVYYTAVSSPGSLITGLCVDVDSRDSAVYTFSGYRLVKNDEEFSDSIIKNSIEIPATLSFIIHYASGFAQVMKECATRSTGCWLCFATLGLPLIAVIGIRRFSKWRLVSVAAIAVVSLGVVLFNLLSYVEPAVVNTESVVNDVLSKIPPFKAISAVGNPCVVLFNLVAFLVLLVLFFVYEHKGRSAYYGGSY